MSKRKPLKRRPAPETLELRTLLSSGQWVPLDKVFLQGLTQAGSLPPLSAINLYSPSVAHTLTPAGQGPPGSVEVGVGSDTGEPLFAVADRYIVQINLAGLGAAAAADPKQLLAHAQGELAQAKATNPADTALVAVNIDAYVGAGRYLVTAGTNDTLGDSSPLETALARLLGFQGIIPDYLFPASELKAPTRHATNTPTPTPPTSTPLSEVGAPGTLVFTGSLSQGLYPGSTISYSVNLDAGQTLAAVITPASGLQATLRVLNPNGKVIGSATGSAPGALTALQAIRVSNSGTYQVAVGGVGGSSGNFILQTMVNALLQSQRYLGGPNDGIPANAQRIDTTPLNLGNGISRSAVYGNIPVQPSVGDAFVSEQGVGVQLVSSAGVVEATLNNPALSAGLINGMHIGPNGNLYVGVDTSPGNGTGGEIVEMTQTGNVVAVIKLPNDTPSFGYYYPFGFAVAPDGTFWVAQPNTGNVVHVGASGNLIRSYSVGGNPEWTAVRSDGQVFVSQDADSIIQQLDPTSGTVTTFASDPGGLPLGLSFDASGNLLVADPDVGVLRFNTSGSLIQTISDFYQPIDAEVDPSGNVLASTGFATLDKFTSDGTLISSAAIGGPGIGLGVVGTEGPTPPPPQPDYYTFSLARGQNATVVLSDLGANAANIAVVSSDGTVLALGKVISGSEQAIHSFIASATGTYYLRVTGNDVQYSLVVETGADVSNGTNTSLATAQNLFPSSKGVESVLGSITSTSLWGVDWQDAPNQLIHAINTLTGQFNSTLTAPSTPLANPFGFNMAFDGTHLWFNDGALYGSNTLYKLDPATGAVLGSFPSPTPELTGLAYLNGSLWGTDTTSIYKINPSTGQLVGQFTPAWDDVITGLAGDPSRGVLWAVSQTHTLYEIDPVHRVILQSAPDGLGLFEQDLGYYNNELYVSETNGPGANDIAVFNADSLTETRDLPVNVANSIAGLAADGLSLVRPNDYHIRARANDTLTITATAPYSPSQGPFQPANSLDVYLQLYDAKGHLLATSVGGPITYDVKTAGDYYVAISGRNRTAGDYTLSVSGATGRLPAFKVTGTNPPAHSYNKPLQSITVDFNDTVLLSSLFTANVTFDGLAPTGYTVDNDHEITWYLQATPPGFNIPYTFQIAAGSIKDIHGVGLTGFSETIIINTVPPHLITTSIEEGDIDPAGNLTYVTSFQEPIVPSSVSDSSFDLHGNFRNADYAPTSFHFDRTDTILTINYTGLPQDRYTLTLFSDGFTDRAGWNLDGLPHTPRPPSVPTGNGQGNTNFFVDFTLRHGNEALPVAFGPVAPAGDQIDQGSFQDVVAAPAGSTNTYTVALAPNQTLTLDLTSDASLRGTIALYDASNHLIASATAATRGAEVVLQTAPIAASGTYTIVVGGVNNTEGLFNVVATLNAAVTTGTPSNLGKAQNISGSFLALGGTASRGAVLGSIDRLVAHTGDAYASEHGGPGIVVVANAGGVKAALSSPVFAGGVVQGMHEGPDGDLYVGFDTSNGNGNGGEILKFSPSGTLILTIGLPNDPNQGGFYYYPFGFAVAPDGTFWVAQPNTGNVVHVGASGNLIRSYSVGGTPEWTAVRSDGQVFVSQDAGGIIRQLHPNSGTVTTYATDPYGAPFGLSFTTSGNLLVADPYVGVLVYSGGNLIRTVRDAGALDAQLDPKGNFMIGNANTNSVDKFDPKGNPVTSTGIHGTPIGLSVAGVDGPPPPAASLDNDYSFHLNAGQSVSIAYDQLGGTGTASVYLKNGSGQVLATARTGPANYTQAIANFVATTAGTYYIDIHGDGITYSLTVTRNAAFDTEPNNTQATAQPLPAAGGAVGAINPTPGVTVGTKLEGLNSNDTAGYYPPDTNDAVGPTQVVEAVNLTLRVYAKSSENILLTQDMSSLFGISAYSDPYIVYDDIAHRFVMAVLTANPQGGDGVALVVSKDSNVLDGWLPAQVVDFGSNLLDFPKVGFNADAYVITGNLFTTSGTTPLQFIAVDKARLFNGNFVDDLYQRDSSHFRAEVPAQMHGAKPGMPMYLVEEAGFENGQAARVVTLTNELSNNPTFVDTDIPVDPYGAPPPADQPGGIGTVATNDTTFSHADWRMINGRGMLVSAQNVGVPDDGYATSRVRWYEFDTSGTPSLVQQGTIAPGPGVSTYYGAPALNINGDIGITYMESSSSKYVSMYVAGRLATDPPGTMSAGVDVAPGIATGSNFIRTGDYGGMSVDPTNGLTFWASHEYAGTDLFWNTALASFTVQSHHDVDWYSVAAKKGENLQVTLTVPGSSTGAQFADDLSPVIQLYAPNGKLLATASSFLSYVLPSAGTYAIRVSGANNTRGEYVLLVQDPPKAGTQAAVTRSTSGPTVGAPAGNALAVTPPSGAASQPSSYAALDPSEFATSASGAAATTRSSTDKSATAKAPAQATSDVTYAAEAISALYGVGASTSAEDDIVSSLATWLAGLAPANRGQSLRWRQTPGRARLDA